MTTPVITSSSSSFCSSSTSSAASSPSRTFEAQRKVSSHRCKVASTGYPESLEAEPVMACDFIQVPPDFRRSFAYLHDTQLFFFDVLRKLNRLRAKDRRVCFVTDYTINIASCASGKVTRCSKVEDVAELICDPKTRAVGIRMRGRPFAIEPHDYLHWNCFYEMPVDLLLFAESTEQFDTLLRVLQYVYVQCTGEALPLRCLENGEEWGATLVLWPDGSRVKKNAMFYHRVPLSSSNEESAVAIRAASTPAAAAAAAASPLITSPASHETRKEKGKTSDGKRAMARVEVPRTRGAAWPTSARPREASLVSSPPPRRPPPPSQRSLSRPVEGRQLELEVAAAETEKTLFAPPRTRDMEAAQRTDASHPQLHRIRTTAVDQSHSATRRKTNPLLHEEEPTAAAEAPATVVTTTSEPARAHAAPSGEEATTPARRTDAAKRFDASSLLYSPATPTPQVKEKKMKSKMKALEEVVKEQQLCIRELRQSRYSKECELDDLKRHLNSVTSQHDTRSSQEPSQRRQRMQLPSHNRKTGHSGCSASGKESKSSRHHRHATTSSTSLNGSGHSSSHEAHLSSVKPIQKHAERRRHGHHSSNKRRGGGERNDEAPAAAGRGAEVKLKDALQRHRQFEETVWAYYKALPVDLQEKLITFQRGRAECQSQSHASHSHHERSTEKELTYLRELVRQSQRVSARSRANAAALSEDDSMTHVGDQIDAFAEELARKQQEINQLRQQLRDTTNARK